jgi:Mg/Co/Ni transporter MgtE
MRAINPTNPYINPYAKALEGRAMNSALSRLEPPAEIKMALDNFRRRMNDPEAFPEIVAIYKQRNLQGLLDYITEGTKLTEAWYGRPRSL